MDIVPPYDRKLDVRKGLPYPDRTVSGIYSEHFLEHLTQAEGLCFLRECRRVLLPGGTIRIAMPDLDEFIGRYMSEDWRGDADMFRLGYGWVANRCEMLNFGMRLWGHKHLYNEEELIRVARMAGLEPLRRCEHGVSEVPMLASRETRAGSRLIMEFELPDRPIPALPLVSVLIPAYRADWFREALDSALAQTYRHLEIIVCDDSQDDAIEQIARQAATTDSRIAYFRNQPPLGCLGNFLQCYRLARGEFIKFLNDDDLLAPACIEKMLQAFRDHPGVTLVTSYRRPIDENGTLLPDLPATRRLSRGDCELDAASSANAMIQNRLNFIGEPSTVLFRKSDLDWVEPNIATFGGRQAVGAGDAAMWLNLLGRGSAYYLTEALSSFRIHPGQRQNEPAIQIAGLETWHSFLLHGLRLGFVTNPFGWFVKARDETGRRFNIRIIQRSEARYQLNLSLGLLRKKFTL